jgi:hypothetical protein
MTNNLMSWYTLKFKNEKKVKVKWMIMYILLISFLSNL